MAAVLLLVVIAVPAGLLMRPAFRQWRIDQAMGQARAYANDQDYRNLALSLRRVSQLAPGDAETWREVAQHLSALGAPETLAARKNVLTFDPSSLADRIHLAADALRFGEAATAQSALNLSDPPAVTDADFQRISATLAILLGDTPAILEHLEALIALEPDNRDARYNLAMVQLLRSGAARRQHALDLLQQLLGEPTVQVRAALELLKDAGRHRDADHAKMVFDLILARLAPNRPPPAPARFEDLITALQQTAESEPADVARVGRWLAEVRRKTEALRWIDSLPSDTRLQPPVTAVTAELVLGTDQLDRAYSQLHAGALGPIGEGTILLALAARQQSLLGKSVAARSTWLDAVALAEASDVSSLHTLVQIGSTWAEPTWVTPALQSTIATAPRAFWAYTALRDIYFNLGQTRALWELFDRWVLVQPDNELIVYEWIRYGSVLTQIPRSLQQNADRLLGALPASTRVTLTKAAWAWRQDDFPQAATLIRSIASEAGDMPEITYWHYLIMSDQLSETRAVSALPDRDLPLLPDEKKRISDRLESAEKGPLEIDAKY